MINWYKIPELEKAIQNDAFWSIEKEKRDSFDDMKKANDERMKSLDEQFKKSQEESKKSFDDQFKNFDEQVKKNQEEFEQRSKKMDEEFDKSSKKMLTIFLVIFFLVFSFIIIIVIYSFKRRRKALKEIEEIQKKNRAKYGDTACLVAQPAYQNYANKQMNGNTFTINIVDNSTAGGSNNNSSTTTNNMATTPVSPTNNSNPNPNPSNYQIPMTAVPSGQMPQISTNYQPSTSPVPLSAPNPYPQQVPQGTFQVPNQAPPVNVTVNPYGGNPTPGVANSQPIPMPVPY